jgi:hypothetical protein
MMAIHKDPNHRFDDPEQNPVHTCFGCDDCVEDVDATLSEDS